ncbi:MAG: hypothetical protein KDJ88_20860, partial [Bauldia sp.]|nr:hypothetical protein [Bauldia sp.]
MMKKLLAAVAVLVPLTMAGQAVAKSKEQCQKQAENYADKNTKTLGSAALGGVIGAVGGAVVGGALGGNKGAGTGALIGGAGGAVAGTI